MRSPIAEALERKTKGQVLSFATLYQGGDDPLPTDASGGSASLCCLLQCLLKDKSVIDLLEHLKLDARSISHCINGCCTDKMPHSR